MFIFFVVWSVLLFGLFGCFFFAVGGGGGGALFFCCCLGRGPGPAQTAKKKHTHPPKQQKKTRSEGAGACFFFCSLGGRRVLFFAVWAGACFFFAVWAGACFFFAVWAGGVFFAVWAGDGIHSLTRLPGSSLSDPTTKETEQQKKKGSLGSIKTRPKKNGSHDCDMNRLLGNVSFMMDCMSSVIRRAVLLTAGPN